MGSGEGVGTQDDIRDALPGTAIGGLVQASVFIFLGIGIAVQPNTVFLNERDDALVHTFPVRPKEPFLHRGLEIDDVEAAHKGRVQIGELVLFALVDGRYDAAALGEPPACERAVQRQVHDGLEYLRAGAVQFVQEEDDGLPVQRKPVRRHEFRLAGLLVLVRDTDEVARVGHLAEEECNHRHTLALEEFGEDFGLADAVAAHEHDVMAGGRHLQQLKQFSCVNAYI